MLRIPFIDKRGSATLASSTSELSRRSRFLTAIVGVGLLAMLALASQLRPDPRGWGTHEQIGLPPCTFLTLFGKRCPACGMTTAWSNVMHGHLVEAARANTSGTVLAAVAMIAAAWALAVSIQGRRLAWQPGETVVAAVAVGMSGLVLGEWLIRLWSG
jgi:hypothetical protein